MTAHDAFVLGLAIGLVCGLLLGYVILPAVVDAWRLFGRGE